MKHLFLGISFLMAGCQGLTARPFHSTVDMGILRNWDIGDGRDSMRFPQDWLGRWEGDLRIYNGRGLAQTIPMALEMAPTDSAGRYRWAIIYDKEERPYELYVVDASQGRYVVDEKNTIAMESYLLGNKLWCCFSVQGSLLVSTYELRGKKMIFEIMAGSETPVSSTGGKVHEGEEIPVVKTFPVNVMQRAELKRVRK